MTEDQLDQEALGWLAEVGYSNLYGPGLARMAIPLSAPITGRWCWSNVCVPR